MAEESQIVRANRQMIAERQALLAERDRLAQVLKQRSVNVAVEFVEGLGQLVEQAATGEPASLQVLSQFIDRLERARSLRLGIVLPTGGNGGSGHG